MKRSRGQRSQARDKGSDPHEVVYEVFQLQLRLVWAVVVELSVMTS